jgi:hypothetical protein
VDAAKLYEKSGSQFNIMEAAGAYEDAFKAYSSAKQTGTVTTSSVCLCSLARGKILTCVLSSCEFFLVLGLAIQCLEKAAKLFRRNERGGSRAAKVYNQLGDLLKSEDAKRAADMYREAAELFESDGDG